MRYGEELHWSDCAVNSEPAYPAGPCDCGADKAAQHCFTYFLRFVYMKGICKWHNFLYRVRAILGIPQSYRQYIY